MDSVDKFAALAEALDVGDDTDAIERLVPPRPTVRSALESGRTPSPSTSASDEIAADAVRPKRSHRTRTTPSVPASGNRPTSAEGSRIRSSANLPVSVWERVSAAKDIRWELSEILACALQRPAATSESAERRHRSFRGELRVQRQYRATAEQRDLLDQLAGDWRMSRSEVVAVLLDAELDKMGEP